MADNPAILDGMARWQDRFGEIERRANDLWNAHLTQLAALRKELDSLTDEFVETIPDDLYNENTNDDIDARMALYTLAGWDAANDAIDDDDYYTVPRDSDDEDEG